jgi:hypothetical protein
MSDTGESLGALGLISPYGDKKRLEGYLTKYEQRANQATVARADARSRMGDATTRNLAAIDELTSDIKKNREGRWNLPLLSFGAGMLQPPPLEGSNFGNELGRGLAAAVPAIGRQRMEDDEFYRRLGELKAARAQAEMAPVKSDLDFSEKQLSEAEKQRAALEAADVRTLPAEEKQRISNERNWAGVLKQADQMFLKMTEGNEKADGGELTGGEKDLLRKLAQAEAIQQYNAGLDPSSPNYINPDKVNLTPEERKRAEELRTGLVPVPKTQEERDYKDYVREAKAKGETPLSLPDWKTKRVVDQKTEAQIAEEAAKTKMALPGFMSGYERMHKLAGELGSMPGLEDVVGPKVGKYPASMVLGAQAQNFLRQLETLKSQSFLNSIKAMQGMGALSNAEGAKVEAALASLERTQEPDQFRTNLKTIQQALDKMKEAMLIQADPDKMKAFAANASRRQWPEPTPAAIEMLKANPATRQHFDDIYGPGAAAKVLGG